MKLYPLFLQEQLKGTPIDFTANNIKCALVTSAYTQSDAHQFVSSLTGILGRSGNLASKTETNGTFDAADPTVTVATAGTVVAVVFYKDTGVDGTSPLIAFDDKQNDGTTAISQVVAINDVVTVQLHASGLFDL